jgi:predicted metalloprotease
VRFDDSRVDTSGLDDRRGGGSRMPGGAVGVGGIGGLGIIGVILWLLLGGSGDPTSLLTESQTTTSSVGSTSGQAAGGESLAVACSTPTAIDTRDDCFVLKVFNETDEVWTDYYAGTGQQYLEPRLVYYDRATTTGGCGNASANAGPFYCPADQRVYIDLNFLNQLQTQYGFNGRYATAYIVAHEVGHHIQTISGIEGQVRKLQQSNPRMANQYSVLMELQADCLAGVWGRKANDAGNVVISEAEYGEALRAAAAVGDDAIMSGAGLRVNPEKFTHGSSAQRQQWFTTGFDSGDPASCNTFA